MSLSSLLLLDLGYLAFLCLVSSNTAKPLWQLRSEAFGDRIGRSYPCPLLARRGMTSGHTKHDPPDILFSLQIPLETSKDDPGEAMQLWSPPGPLAVQFLLLVSHKVIAHYFCHILCKVTVLLKIKTWYSVSSKQGEGGWGGSWGWMKVVDYLLFHSP